MNKPTSLRINELLKTGEADQAFKLAMAAHKQFPKITIYKQLVDICSAKVSESKNHGEIDYLIASVRDHNQEIDRETFEYHLKKKLEKVRSKEIGAIQAWNDVSFLAPSNWPKDPRLSRLIAPTAASLDVIRQQDKSSILILSGDITGGAGIAALRTYECLNGIGRKTDIAYRDKDVLCLRKHDNHIIEIITEDLTPIIYEGFDLQLIEEIRAHIWNEVHLTMAFKGQGSNTFLFHSEESLDIRELSKLYEGINIHWADFLLTSTSLERIKDYANPITITLHDMYWLNGSCHYSAGCTQFHDSCISCPLVTRTSETIRLFNQFHKTVLNSLQDLSTISPSLWLCQLASQSKSLSNRDSYFILNPQVNKCNERPYMGARGNERPITIIYGALGLTEKRKGYELFVGVCKEIRRKGCNIKFKVFGSLDAEQKQEIESYSCEVLGFLTHQELASQFSNSDVLLMISHEDNYPNLCVEAAALGLPIIASNNSGLKSFIEVSKGGLLVSNNALEISDTISHLTRSDIAIFSEKIFAWCQECYDNTKLEEAYQSVILRKSNRDKYLFNSATQNINRALNRVNSSHDNFSKYVTNISDFGVEVLVPINAFNSDKYSLSYTLEGENLRPPTLYIDGRLYEGQAVLNSDKRTYRIDDLPVGKPAKLIKYDATSNYFYKELQIASVNIYPNKLSYKNNGHIIAPKETNQSKSTEYGMFLSDDGIAIEKSNESTVYWLLANRRYSLHLYKMLSSDEQVEPGQDSSSTITIIFNAFDLRHDPVSQIRIEINSASESIYLIPTIDGNKFIFTIEKDLLNAMVSSFLITGAGERLEDGRDVVALIDAYSTQVE